MPATLTLDEYGAAIGEASTVLRANAGAVSLDTPVPTCPDWSVRDLVVHQGMVHRSAAATLRGEQGWHAADFEADGQASPDVLDWFDDGAAQLLQAVVDAPDDMPGHFFLRDAGPLRDAWARRQAHETVIHAVDAMAARLGGPPTAAQTWFSPEFAGDGADELMLGFLPRRRSPLRSQTPLTLTVAIQDTGHAWQAEISEEPPVVRAGRATNPDVVLSGNAREVYLALWNRGTDIRVDGDDDAYGLWQRLMRVIY
ncbi:MAG: maleylpyruvate isomerase N-terminal domain-containing protein [Nostocoides sp.]